MGPSNLEILERGLNQLQIRWTAASGPVTGYRVQRVPLTGLGQPIVAERQEVSAPTCLLSPWGPPAALCVAWGWRGGDTVPVQVSLGPRETSTVLRGLRVGTEYLVTVTAQYANSIGESVSGRARTRECPCPQGWGHGQVLGALSTWGWGLIPGSVCPQRAVLALCWISAW